MTEHLSAFYPPTRILLGPGPSLVHPRVLQALTMPILGHLDPDFLKVMDDVRLGLHHVFRTRDGFTIAVSGTGTAGMEAALCNILEHGDTIVVCVNGFFGERLVDIAQRCGATVVRLDFPWGQPVDPNRVETALKSLPRVKAVAMVHAETSTGVKSPPHDIARLAHQHDALLVLDCVTSLGGEELYMDDWGIDVAYSATQKCLGAPPGLAPICFSPRAMEVVNHRKTRVQSLYLDITVLRTYWGTNRTYHHTAPISMVYAFREALRMLMEEGLEERWRRHAHNAAALRAGVQALGLQLFAQDGYRLNPLTAVRIPDGIDDKALRADLISQFNIEVGAGLGPIAGKVWRIGLMGESSREANVLQVLSALERLLPRHGYEVAVGAGVAAAGKALAS